MKLKALLIISAALAAALAGCGKTSGGGPDTPQGSIESSAVVGMGQCLSCHMDSAKSSRMPVVVGDSPQAKANGQGWLNGPHGNNEGLHNEDHGADNEGFPSHSFFTGPTCANCHDQLGDGQGLAAFSAEAYGGAEALGRVARPVVGCESCHGPGGSHFALGPIMYATPEASRCGQCHNAAFSHNAYHPEGDEVYEDYSASGHSRSINDHVYADAAAGTVRALCSKCHTDEGARKYKDVEGGYAALGTLIPSSTAPIEGASAVQCRTCHDPHNPSKLLKDETTDAQGNVVLSAEYRTCTTCHQSSDSYHGENSRYSWSGMQVGVGTFDGGSIIYDTHADDPATDTIEGYVLNPASERSCRDCHNQHSANIEINEQWAHSGHGGRIASTVDPITGRGRVDATVAPAWSRDFKASSSSACQRCHTSTGFKNFSAGPAMYNAASNVFAATGQQREMLYCWACHKDNSGGLRDPGPMAASAPYTVPAARLAAVPDLNGSNVCVSCHSGREAGQEIKGAQIAGKNFGSFNSHYLPAGGVLFRTIGYEYAGRNYDNESYFVHDRIGADDNGPCVGCHMRSDEGHSMESVAKDAAGAVTKVNSFEHTCKSCHLDEQALIALINEEDEGYEASMNYLQGLLLARGIFYGSGYPYFFRVATGQSTATAYTAWPNEDTLGAAYNLNLFRHMGGAFVHNSLYTKRLLYDSMDFVDNGAMDSSSLNAAPQAVRGFLAQAAR